MVKFKCGKTQIYEAIKNKNKLMEQWVSCKNSGKSKRVVSVGYELVGRDLYRWFINCRSKSLPSLDLLYKQRPLNWQKNSESVILKLQTVGLTGSNDGTISSANKSME